MDKKYLKWCILAPVILMTLAIIGAIVYLVAPPVIDAIIGSHTEEGLDLGETCDFSAVHRGGLTTICEASGAFLGGTIMILIVLAGAIAAIAGIITAIDAATLPGLSGAGRLLWVIVALLFQFVGPLAYYIIVRRDKK